MIDKCFFMFVGFCFIFASFSFIIYHFLPVELNLDIFSVAVKHILPR